ncbi:MAG TPA: hypothetical protein VFC00_04105 [Micromonosporaceae bacterium]|nr:hypothetical protein [Micromonosporaceae bacterium]
MSHIEDCLRQVMAVQGALGASLVDYPSGSAICAAGPVPANDGQLVRAAMNTAASTAIGQPDRIEDIVVTAGDGYHVVHILPGDRLALYVWLDRMLGNIALTQRTMRVVGMQFAAG